MLQRSIADGKRAAEPSLIRIGKTLVTINYRHADIVQINLITESVSRVEIFLIFLSQLNLGKDELAHAARSVRARAEMHYD